MGTVMEAKTHFIMMLNTDLIITSVKIFLNYHRYNLVIKYTFVNKYLSSR